MYGADQRSTHRGSHEVWPAVGDVSSPPVMTVGGPNYSLAAKVVEFARGQQGAAGLDEMQEDPNDLYIPAQASSQRACLRVTLGIASACDVGVDTHDHQATWAVLM